MYLNNERKRNMVVMTIMWYGYYGVMAMCNNINVSILMANNHTIAQKMAQQRNGVSMCGNGECVVARNSGVWHRVWCGQ